MTNNTYEFNPEVLRQLMQMDPSNGPGLIIKLIGMFVDIVPKSFTEMEAHIANKNFDALGKVAHSIKGSSGNLGAMSMMKICSEIEHLTFKNQNKNPKDEALAVEKFAELKVAFKYYESVLNAIAQAGGKLPS